MSEQDRRSPARTFPWLLLFRAPAKDPVEGFLGVPPPVRGYPCHGWLCDRGRARNGTPTAMFARAVCRMKQTASCYSTRYPRAVASVWSKCPRHLPLPPHFMVDQLSFAWRGQENGPPQERRARRDKRALRWQKGRMMLGLCPSTPRQVPWGYLGPGHATVSWAPTPL